MRESVSALLIYDDEVFLIKRQNHLKAFPGYFSFPGGKVDKEDNIPSSLSEKYNIESRFINALFRELEEELSFDLRLSENQKIVKDMA